MVTYGVSKWNTTRVYSQFWIEIDLNILSFDIETIPNIDGGRFVR